MINMIEWSQDELTQLRKIEKEFLILKKWYLGTTIFLTVIFALSYICSLLDQEYRPFVVPSVLTVAFVAAFSQFFFIAGRRKSFFFDDETLGYKMGSQLYKLKWDNIIAVETKAETGEKFATITFKPRTTKTLIQPDLVMTVEKESEIYHQLMQKIASQNLPVTAV